MPTQNDFRGIPKNNPTQGFIYGDLRHCDTGHVAIIPQGSPSNASGIEVMPITVGQYTGRCIHATGELIYEGDITTGTISGKFTIVWDTRNCRFACEFLEDDKRYGKGLPVTLPMHNMRLGAIVGSIHDRIIKEAGGNP